MAESHDQIFKDLICAFPQDFIVLTAPDLGNRIDFSTLELQPTESFLDLPRGRQRRLDWLARADSRHGERILLHLEIELRANPEAVERLWHYNRLVHLRKSLPVHSFMLNLHGGTAGICRRRHRETSLGRQVCVFAYTCLGLSGAPASSFLARRIPLAWALAALMRWPRAVRPAQRRLLCLKKIARARRLSESQRFLLFNVVVTYIQLNPAATAEYEALLAERHHTKERTMVMTWADEMEAKWTKVGVEKGIQQGVVQGMRETVLRLLGKRFSPLPPAVMRRVSHIESLEELGRLAERILEARSLSELGLAG